MQRNRRGDTLNVAVACSVASGVGVLLGFLLGNNLSKSLYATQATSDPPVMEEPLTRVEPKGITFLKGEYGRVYWTHLKPLDGLPEGYHFLETREGKKCLYLPPKDIAVPADSKQVIFEQIRKEGTSDDKYTVCLPYTDPPGLQKEEAEEDEEGGVRTPREGEGVRRNPPPRGGKGRMQD